MVETRFDKLKNIAYIKVIGRKSSEEILKAFDASVADERYQKGMARLWDFSETDLSALSADTVRSMTDYSIRFPPGIRDVKVAFVAQRDLEYGLSRMFSLSSSAKTPLNVFKTIEEAERWLAGVERP